MSTEQPLPEANLNIPPQSEIHNNSYNVIALEGEATPDLPLNHGEQVLLDMHQGVRDLGLSGILLRHKGRLILTNQRTIFYQRKTRDFSIEQINMRHTGAISMIRQKNYTQLGLGLFSIFLPFFMMSSEIGINPIITLVFVLAGILLIVLSKVQTLVFSGSGEKILFKSKSITSDMLSKALTAVNSNS
tara:strand:- start:541 stop:1104 length:564 start_codon:yes stop_codon:yes gene_type:complete